MPFYDLNGNATSANVLFRRRFVLLYCSDKQ